MGARQTLVAALTRRYPFYSGCGTFANSWLVRRLSGHADRQQWARVDGGLVLADINEYVGRAAYYVGDLDRKVTWICRRVLRRGDIAVDVGANIGLVTLTLAACVGPSGRILAFEPNPKLYRSLEASIARNGYQNVALYDFALGSSESQLELKIPYDNVGRASLVKNEDVPHESVTVCLKSLDHLLETGPIRLIKIDVEGFEHEVLLGATRILKHDRPLVLFEENSGTDESFRLLEQHGYRFFSVPRCMVRMRLERCHKPSGNDFLAVPADQYDQIAQLVGA